MRAAGARRLIETDQQAVEWVRWYMISSNKMQEVRESLRWHNIGRRLSEFGPPVPHARYP
jgi:hypothetical protein